MAFKFQRWYPTCLFFSSLFSNKGCGFCPLGAPAELGPAPAVLVDAIVTVKDGAEQSFDWPLTRLNRKAGV